MQARIRGTEIARILFVEVHRGFRQSASLLMNREPDLEVVAQAGTVAEGRRMMTEGGIDAAIVDVPLPDEYGIELVRGLSIRGQPLHPGFGADPRPGPGEPQEAAGGGRE